MTTPASYSTPVKSMHCIIGRSDIALFYNFRKRALLYNATDQVYFLSTFFKNRRTKWKVEQKKKRILLKKFRRVGALGTLTLQNKLSWKIIRISPRVFTNLLQNAGGHQSKGQVSTYGLILLDRRGMTQPNEFKSFRQLWGTIQNSFYVGLNKSMVILSKFENLC